LVPSGEITTLNGKSPTGMLAAMVMVSTSITENAVGVDVGDVEVSAVRA